MYDHYIALDWAQNNMAVARMTKDGTEAIVINVPSSLKELQIYLSRLRGKKILTFEETTTAQWLYVELRDWVEEILICDPYRNHLLSEGAKTDRHDATKLAQLLKAGLLKPVFHSADQFIKLRKFVSGYEDVVKAGTRLKNQRAALFRGQGKIKTEKELTDETEEFVLKGIDRGIVSYEEEKKRYVAQIEKLCRKHLMIQHMDQIFGIGAIGAVKIVARVVDPRRFGDKGQWLSYCGLIRHEKLSGGKSYGWRKPRYCRTLKNVFKTAALSVLNSHKVNNPFRNYYEFLLREKGYAPFQARHALARRIAIVAWGVLKSGKPLDLARLTQKQN